LTQWLRSLASAIALLGALAAGARPTLAPRHSHAMDPQLDVNERTKPPRFSFLPDVDRARAPFPRLRLHRSRDAVVGSRGGSRKSIMKDRSYCSAVTVAEI
jgi:hypothetical protein